MKRRSILLLVVSLSLAACGGDGSNCAGPLDELSTAGDQWYAAIEDSKACETDEDCVIYERQSGQCFTSCGPGTAVNAAEVARLESLGARIDERVDLCGAGPCPVPTCAPRAPGAVCIENRCESGDG